MEFRKMVLTNLFARHQWRNRHMDLWTNRLMDIGRGEETVSCLEGVTWKLTFSSVQSLSYIQLFATS